MLHRTGNRKLHTAKKLNSHYTNGSDHATNVTTQSDFTDIEKVNSYLTHNDHPWYSYLMLARKAK